MTSTLNRFVKVKSELYQMQFTPSKKVKAGKMEYDYFELSDFMPQIIESCERHDISQYFTLENDSLYVKGKVVIFREDDNTDVIYLSSCPYPIILIQNPKDLGSLSTYIQRYTYEKAFGITEDCKMEQKIAKENINIDLIDKINRILRQAGKETRTEKEIVELAKNTGRSIQGVLDGIVKKYKKK